MADASVNPILLLPLLQCYAGAALVILGVRSPVWWRLSQQSTSPRVWRVLHVGLASVLGAVAVLVLLGYHLVRTEGVSMEPTLHNGQLMLANANAYAWHWPFVGSEAGRRAPPRMGDVVTVRYPDPKTGHPTLLVKRVVGVQGDRIDTSPGELRVNGVVQPVSPDGLGDWTANGHRLRFVGPQQGLFSGSWVVGPDQVFLMGDHRDRSWDSRWWGPVSVSLLAGRVVWIAPSPSGTEGVR